MSLSRHSFPRWCISSVHSRTFPTFVSPRYEQISFADLPNGRARRPPAGGGVSRRDKVGVTALHPLLPPLGRSHVQLRLVASPAPGSLSLSSPAPSPLTVVTPRSTQSGRCGRSCFHSEPVRGRILLPLSPQLHCQPPPPPISHVSAQLFFLLPPSPPLRHHGQPKQCHAVASTNAACSVWSHHWVGAGCSSVTSENEFTNRAPQVAVSAPLRSPVRDGSSAGAAVRRQRRAPRRCAARP